MEHANGKNICPSDLHLAIRMCAYEKGFLGHWKKGGPSEEAREDARWSESEVMWKNYFC